MRTEHLEILLTVSEILNYKEVAKDYDMVPSNVSILVSNVEQEFGVKIFERDNKIKGITEEGQKLLDRFEIAFDALYNPSFDNALPELRREVKRLHNKLDKIKKVIEVE